MGARQLSARVWLVGGSSDGPAFTSAYDGNQYLVWDGTGGFLIDAGSGLGFQRMVDNVAEVADPARLAGLLVTHYHGDHAGGAAAMARTGVPVLASATCARALIRADESATQVARARDVGVYPVDFALQAVPGVRELRDGDLLEAGDIRLAVLEAPGHCDGHLVFGLEGVGGLELFTGDVLFPGGRVSIQAIPDCRLDQYAATVIRMAELPVTALLPGHGEPELSEELARADIAAAAASFARLVPPPNLLG